MAATAEHWQLSLKRGKDAMPPGLGHVSADEGARQSEAANWSVALYCSLAAPGSGWTDRWELLFNRDSDSDSRPDDIEV